MRVHPKYIWKCREASMLTYACQLRAQPQRFRTILDYRMKSARSLGGSQLSDEFCPTLPGAWVTVGRHYAQLLGFSLICFYETRSCYVAHSGLGPSMLPRLRSNLRLSHLLLTPAC